MNINGQGFLLNLVQGHSDLTFSNFFSLETARPINTKFHMEPLCDREMNVNTNGLHHMTKMAVMPIYVLWFIMTVIVCRLFCLP